MGRDHNAASVIEMRAFGSNTVGAKTAPNLPGSWRMPAVPGVSSLADAKAPTESKRGAGSSRFSSP